MSNLVVIGLLKLKEQFEQARKQAKPYGWPGPISSVPVTQWPAHLIAAAPPVQLMVDVFHQIGG